MKAIPHFSLRLALALSLAFGSSLAASAASKDAPAKRNKGLNIQPVPDVPLPQSVFNIPAQPAEGRNPFFPQSTAVPVPVLKPPVANGVDTTLVMLNGITSPPKRTAMINGRTFEPGEEGEIRTSSGGKVMIKCLEIKSESAIIEVNGQRRELRMRSGL